MVIRFVAGLALVFSSLIPSLAPGAVATCSAVALPREMHERFSSYAGTANVIVIAEITDTEPVPAGDYNPGIPPQAITATFVPIAVLSQDRPLQAFTVGPLHDTASDCSGGPQLQPGDQVLLFLREQVRYPVAAWGVGVFGDTVIFHGSEAVYATAWYPETGSTQPAGTTQQVIQTILEITQPGPAARQAALEYAGLPVGNPPASANPESTVRPPTTGDAGLR